MQRPLQIALSIFLGFIIFLAFKKPLEYWLNSFGDNDKFDHFLSGSIVRGIILISLLIVAHRIKLMVINGLSSPFSVRNAQAFLLPLIIICAGIWVNQDTYKETKVTLLTIFIINAFLIGFTEEFAFRGIMLPLLLKSRIVKSNIYVAVLTSSLFFSLIHYINLFRQPDNFAGVTSQVIFAFCIGTFFAGLFLRTGNIIPVAIIHTLLNLGFGSGELTGQQNPPRTHSTALNPSTDWASLIGTLVVFGFIMMSGLVMVYLSDKDTLMKRLGSDAHT